MLTGLKTVARTLEALLVEFESVAARAAEVAQSAARVTVDGSLDEDSVTVYIVLYRRARGDLPRAGGDGVEGAVGADGCSQRTEDPPADR